MSRPLHTRRLKSFAARTGDPFLYFCGDRVFVKKRQRTLPRVFRVVIGAQKSERCPQGTGATSFLLCLER